MMESQHKGRVVLHLCIVDSVSQLLIEELFEKLTFCDEMPPRSIERVIRSPAVDICSIRVTRAVLKLEGRPVLKLVVQLGESAHVAEPGKRIDDFECLRRSKEDW